MRRACCLQPLVAVDFVIANDVPYPIGEDLSAATRHGIYTGLLHFGQGLGDGQLGAFRQVSYFDHGEGFNVYLGKALLEASHQVEEILERKIGMQATDDVEFGHGFAVSRGSGLPRFFQGHGVSPGSSFLRPKAHSLQAATQTFVGLMWRLTLK